ncbi:MAG: hypothetical protein GY788_08845 [bacterium]|nr:hypothetical protein [bacterium]
MDEFYINTAVAPAKLRHTSMRHQKVTIEAGGLVCDSNQQVIAFMLGVSGHRDARDPSDLWDSIAISATGVGDRLVYLLADIRRPGDMAEHAASSFFHAVISASLDAVHRQSTDTKPATFSEQYGHDQQIDGLAAPIGDWVTERWRQLRPDTPNGYINLATRQPVWRGALTVDSSVPLAPLG